MHYTVRFSQDRWMALTGDSFVAYSRITTPRPEPKHNYTSIVVYRKHRTKPINPNRIVRGGTWILVREYIPENKRFSYSLYTSGWGGLPYSTDKIWEMNGIYYSGLDIYKKVLFTFN